MKKSMALLLLISAGFYPGRAQQKTVPYVILVSFDGFRYDYVRNYNPPNFKKFISKGTQAEALIPSFPSKTFPNHYTIVTGLYPGHHQLVDNQFYDADHREAYGMRDKTKVTEAFFYGGVPLWELAKRNGIKSASYFWVGSEMNEVARRPDYFFAYNGKVSPAARVQQVIDWLRLPEDERPHMITLYFDFPDHEAHDFGPGSEQTKMAVMRADSLLGMLMKGLESIPLPVNTIIVSDHGMSELTVSQETYVSIDELINRKDTSVVVAIGGTQTHVYVSNRVKRDSLYRLLKSKEKNFTVYRQEDFPARWHYNTPRAGDLMIMIAPGHYCRGASWNPVKENARVGTKFGAHGFDPAVVSDMRGIFYAMGPNIKSGLVVKPFENIHIYPLVAKILALPLPPIDGKSEVLDKVYQKK